MSNNTNTQKQTWTLDQNWDWREKEEFLTFFFKLIAKLYLVCKTKNNNFQVNFVNRPNDFSWELLKAINAREILWESVPLWRERNNSIYTRVTNVGKIVINKLSIWWLLRRAWKKLEQAHKCRSFCYVVAHFARKSTQYEEPLTCCSRLMP